MSQSVGLSRSRCRSIAGAFTTLLTVAGLALVSVPAHAQILYGSITGVVKDAQGATVPGATVTAVNKETNLTRDTVTNAEGVYTLTNVLPGPYDVKISLPGFKEAVRTTVPVTIGQISRVDMTLEIGALTESITVASEAQLLQTDKADVHTELKSGEITSMPLNRFRNYQALMSLVPGHDADGVRQRGDRHAGALAGDERQRPGEHEQHHPDRRRHEHEHLAAEPQHVHLAGRDRGHRQRLDEQLRRRAGERRRRGGHGRHQVRHEPVPRLRRSSSTTATS